MSPLAPLVAALVVLPVECRGLDRTADGATLVVEGKVLERNEVWDRRTNPLMGRPDVLKEIILKVEPLRVIRGSLPPAGDGALTVSAKDRVLLEAKKAGVGGTGIFRLAGDKSPFECLGFEPRTPPPPAVRPKPAPAPAPKPLPFPENLGGRQVRDDRDLRERAVGHIAGKYGMSGASAVFLTSHQGPCPPEGGYVYWGVKGKVKGAWHVWQPGYGGKLRRGTDLIDPKRYQK